MKERISKLWIIKGLQNARKNTFYKYFLKLRTVEAENRYKKYKNKLVSKLRKQKKDYYRKLLEEKRNDMKDTWGIIYDNYNILISTFTSLGCS